MEISSTATAGLLPLIPQLHIVVITAAFWILSQARNKQPSASTPHAFVLSAVSLGSSLSHKNLSEPLNAHRHIKENGCLQTQATDFKSGIHNIS